MSITQINNEIEFIKMYLNELNRVPIYDSHRKQVSNSNSIYSFTDIPIVETTNGGFVEGIDNDYEKHIITLVRKNIGKKRSITKRASRDMKRMNDDAFTQF